MLYNKGEIMIDDDYIELALIRCVSILFLLHWKMNIRKYLKIE